MRPSRALGASTDVARVEVLREFVAGIAPREKKDHSRKKGVYRNRNTFKGTTCV